MSNQVKRIEYYYVTVEDKRGEGYWILEHLVEKNINLISFTAFPLGGGRSQMDFVPEDADKFKAAADEAHIELVGPKRAFLLLADDKIGGILEIHRKISNAGVNVHAANAIATGDGKFGLILWVDHKFYEEAARALGV